MATFHSAPRANWPANLVPGDLWLDVATNPNTLFIVASDGSQVPVDALCLSGNLRAETDPPQKRTAAISFQIDNGGAVLGTGLCGAFTAPVNAAVAGWVLLADLAGDAVVDVVKSSFADFPTASSIAGSDLPTLSNAQKAENLNVDGSVWSTALLKGDVLQLNLISCSTCTRLNLSLIVTV